METNVYIARIETFSDNVDMREHDSLKKKSEPYTMPMGFRHTPSRYSEVVQIENEQNWNRSEIIRRCFELGFPIFKKKYLKNQKAA
jgi:hypothetical protein